ncbi:MAG TPA: MBL fold metallo-hydrolase [Armatimonadota bacterium]|nr:MBL fold metallo-hydrolase [Armatimonadota bacterium]
MKVRILGTAAAEGWPGLFCGCETCKKARAAGGKNLRSRASLQIDDFYKIDFPPDTFYHVMKYGLDLSRLKYLFITHSHEDHFAKDEFEYILPGFAHNVEAPIRIYGNSAVIDALKQIKESSDAPEGLVELTEIKPFEPVKADHLTFTPIKAEHKYSEQAVNYLVQSESKTMLYASDTGRYSEAAIELLSRQKIDIAVIECTLGLLPWEPRTHMTFGAVLELRDMLVKSGAVDSNTQLVITHFSHNIGLLHEELEQIASPEDFTVAYDGIMLEV